MRRDVPSLPRRPSEGHKGTFGTVGILGGQAASPRPMIGGPCFTALAALRTGAGLAVLAVPEPIIAHALAIAPSATGLALPVDDERQLHPSGVAALLDEYINSFACLALGPGLGTGIAQEQIVVRLVSRNDPPLVIDADALNALASLPDFHSDFRCHAIITPHPGEYARLARALGLDHDPTDEPSRRDAVVDLAQRLGCVVVLKGEHTLVSNGIDIWMNDTGNAALATAGTGDVLTGLIAGFVAQHHRDHLGIGWRSHGDEREGGLSLYDCARLGVYLHGLAGDLWRQAHGDRGLLAEELVDLIPRAISQFIAAQRTSTPANTAPQAPESRL